MVDSQNEIIRDIALRHQLQASQAELEAASKEFRASKKAFKNYVAGQRKSYAYRVVIYLKNTLIFLTTVFGNGRPSLAVLFLLKVQLAFTLVLLFQIRNRFAQNGFILQEVVLVYYFFVLFVFNQMEPEL